MANHTYDNINDWKILPVSSIVFWINNEYHEFKNIGEDSSFRLSPITRNDGSGGLRTVALRFEGRFHIVENNIEDISMSIESMCLNEAESFIIDFKALPGQANGEKVSFQVDEINSSFNHWAFSWLFESNDNNISIQLFAKGIISIDSLTASMPLFRQYW